MSKKDLYYCIALSLCAVLAVGSGIILSTLPRSPLSDAICLLVLFVSWYIGILVLGSFVYHLLWNDGK